MELGLRTRGGGCWFPRPASPATNLDRHHLAWGSFVNMRFLSKIPLWTLLLLQSGNVTGQWQHTFGGIGTDEGVDVLAMADGGCVVLGSTGSFGQGAGDFYLLRLDGTGERLWSRTYGSPQTEQATALASCPAGGFILAGNRAGSSGYNSLLIRVDDDGETLWEREYGGEDWDMAYAVVSLEDGFVVAGQTYSFGDGSGKAWLFKTDLDGEVLWNTTHGMTGPDEARAVALGTNGDLVVAGTFRSGTPASADAVMFRVNGEGTLIWTVPLGGDEDEMAYGLTSTEDGSFVLSGWTESILPHRTMYMTKVSEAGEQLWTRYTEGGEGAWEGRRIHELSDGTLVVAGYTEAFGNGSKDMYMWHTDQDGYYLQGPTFGGVQNETGAAVVGTDDGGFIMVGSASSFGPGTQAVFVVKNFGSPEIPPVQVFDDPLSVPSGGMAMSVMSVFPNPLRRGENLHFHPLMNERRITLLEWVSSSGSVLYSAHGSDTWRSGSINVPDLSPGMYTLNILCDGLEMRIPRVMVVP